MQYIWRKNKLTKAILRKVHILVWTMYHCDLLELVCYFKIVWNKWILPKVGINIDFHTAYQCFSCLIWTSQKLNRNEILAVSIKLQELQTASRWHDFLNVSGNIKNLSGSKHVRSSIVKLSKSFEDVDEILTPAEVRPFWPERGGGEKNYIFNFIPNINISIFFCFLW